jgi:hypothetical protein
MKRSTLLRAAAAFVGLGLTASSASAAVGIVGSKHDFTKYAWSGNEICKPCHIPHNALVTLPDGSTPGGPLWNHALSTATYTLFDNSTAGAGDSTKIDTNSQLCLSCHDGTVALDSFGGATGTLTMGATGSGTGASANLGTDLRADHPIGATAKITDPVYMVPQASRDAAGVMPARLLKDGSKVVGCTSCHEPHNRKGTTHMLWIANDGTGVPVGNTSVTTATGSALCLSCHKK